uniref:Uncharacterized protein n=1 Tax=Arundo donax TaxID=35708 RepID=A0A0A9EUL9_ARUDO
MLPYQCLSNQWMRSEHALPTIQDLSSVLSPEMQDPKFTITFGLYRRRQRHRAQAILTQAPCSVPWPRHTPQSGSEAEVRSHYQFQTLVLPLVALIARPDSFLM